MKKIIATLSLVSFAAGAFAQGTVTFNNTASTLFSTNSTAVGGTAGNTAPSTSGNFYYDALFTAASTVTTIDVNGQNLLSSTWTFTGAYGTNSAATAGGRLSGGVQAAASWPAGATNSFVVVGWSANQGTTWAQISAELAGATYANNEWTGGGFVNGGYFGITGIGFAAAGGGSAGLPNPNIFGVPSATGNPIGTPTTLFVTTTVPEPSTFALAGLGAAAMLIFRRRK